MNLRSYLAFFESEVDQAIRVLYLAYWIQHSKATLESKRAALDTARERLRQDIANSTAEYDAIGERIPAMNTEAIEIARDADQLRVDLQRREEQLVTEANHNVQKRHKLPSWKKGLRVIGTIASFVPAVSSVASMAGSVGHLFQFAEKVSEHTVWDRIASMGSLADLIASGHLDDAYKEVRNAMTTLEKEEKLEENINNIQKKYKTLQEAVERIKAGLKEREAPKNEIEAELAKLRASDTILNDLIDRLANLLARQEVLARELTESTQRRTVLLDTITQDYLAIDSFNDELAGIGFALDMRAVTYLNEMERRARERLDKYYYTMAKAYEYRLLRPYRGTLNLERILEQLRGIADAANSTEHLTVADFNALKAIYEEQLANIAAEIFSDYAANRPELSAPVYVDFSSDQIVALNAGNTVTINLLKANLFPLNEENRRIVDVELDRIVVTPQGDIGQFGFLDFRLGHSGRSLIEYDGEVYEFVHNNDATARPLEWGARYDAITGTVSPIKPSPAAESLLRTLLVLRGIATTPENMLLYSRSGTDADITVTRSVNTSSGVGLRIDAARLKLTYDFMRRNKTQSVLDVAVEPASLLPHIALDGVDRNGRQDGRGEFHRCYIRGQSVTVSAQPIYGSWTFARWLRRDTGQELGDSTIQVYLGANVGITAEYACDCNGNGIPDNQDLDRGTSRDCNTNRQPDECEPDGDADGVIDACDNCPGAPNKGQEDWDKDGLGNVCDSTPGSANPDTPDPNVGGGFPPADADGDGVPDTLDQCAGTPAGEMGTRDASGCSDSQRDTDKDGATDNHDECPETPEGTQVDTSGCPLPPPDSDGDGVVDASDQCPNTPSGAQIDAQGCAASQRDTDGDGVTDDKDECPDTPTGAMVDANGCVPPEEPREQPRPFPFCGAGVAECMLGVISGLTLMQVCRRRGW